jgi:hypothetical protein
MEYHSGSLAISKGEYEAEGKNLVSKLLDVKATLVVLRERD